jgi:hypothetical protein
MGAKRTIPQFYPTGAAQRAAAAAKRYYATISTDPALKSFRADDPEPCHVIAVRDEQGNVVGVKRRPNYDASDVAHEVEQLNNGTPVSRRSRGRLSGSNRRVKDGGIKLGHMTVPSATEIVVRLVDAHNPTSAKLRALQLSGGTLDRDELPALIEQVVNEWRTFIDMAGLTPAVADRREEQIKKMVASISKQLTDKFGI